MAWIGATAPVRAELTVAAFGDSLMAGYGLPEADGFVARLEAALQRAGYPDIRVIDASVSGDTTSGGKARLGWTLSDDPDLVLVGLGGNDLLRGLDPELTRSNLAAILGQLVRAGVPAVLAGMRAPRSLGREYWQAFDAVYPALAAEYDIPLVPFLLDGIATDPALNQPDGIHPNAKGVAVMVDNVLPVLIEALDDLTAPAKGIPE